MIILNSENFDKETSDLILVDFYADWCPPCRAIAPVLDELSKEYKNKIKFGKLNVDENQEIAARYGVSSIPTIIIFKNTKEIDRTVGAQTKEELKNKIDSILSQ